MPDQSPMNGNGYISRGNLTIILSAAGLIMLALSGFLSWQNAATQRSFDELKADVGKLRELTVAVSVTIAERSEQIKAVKSDVARIDALIAQFTPLAAQRGEQARGFETAITRIDGDLRAAKKEIVSREEHKEKAEKEKVILDGIIERLSRLERELGGTYSLRDEALQDWRDRTETSAQRNGKP